MIAAVIVCDAIVADPPTDPPQFSANNHPCPARTRAGVTPEVVTTLARRDGWSLDNGRHLCPQHAGATP